MLEVPDVSHLTSDEQKKILGVIKRQHEEDEKEKAMMRSLQDQFEDYKIHIERNAAESKTTTTNDNNDTVCALCFKTKFAEGCGHVCSFCEIRFCSRCGGRIFIKSDKTMWVCNLCRKQKEILTKTGAWYNKDSTKHEKSLIHVAYSIGKENLSSSVNGCESSTKDRGSCNAKTLSNQSQHSASVVRCNVLQMLTENKSGNIFPPKHADQNVQKTVTVPNFQEYYPLEYESTLNRSLVDVDKLQNIVNKANTIAKSSPPDDRRLSQVDERAHQNDASRKKYKSVKDKVPDITNGQDKSGAPLNKPPTDCHSRTCTKPVLIADAPFTNELVDAVSAEQQSGYGDYKGSTHLERYVLSSEDDIKSTTDSSSVGDGEKYTSMSDPEVVQHRRMPDQSCYTSDQLSASEPFMEELPVIANSCDCWRLTNINSSFQEECHCSSLQDQLPVSWQPSTDGHFLLGHLTLHKNITNNAMNRGAGTLLGLKVVGGKRTPSGRLGAFITKVRRGSLADIIGHLKPGDEIISWNKYCLQDATFRDVYEIILESQTNSVVELVVSRPIRDIPRIPETRLVQTAESSSCSIDSDRRDYEALPNKPQLGKVQIKLCYDTRNEQLHVTAMKAIHLTMREGGLPRNPYLKMYLLPDALGMINSEPTIPTNQALDFYPPGYAGLSEDGSNFTVFLQI